jgi:DNA primase
MIKKAAKYLNSPESDIYHKSKVLYGIFHAKQAIAKQNNCFLVEGVYDVIQFHQSGIENVCFIGQRHAGPNSD